MLHDINLPLILVAGLIAGASPGPATLAIAGTSMASSSLHGLALASGVVTGSLFWSITAAFGLGAIMLANAWILEVVRVLGAGYLIFLGFKSARSAMTPGKLKLHGLIHASAKRAYFKGLALHLTNPKAIFYFGSLYSIGIPAGTPPSSLFIVIAAMVLLGMVIFLGYALLFSSEFIRRSYLRLRRWFEGIFAIAFTLAGIKILTTRFQ